jgi:hypothetical protein
MTQRRNRIALALLAALALGIAAYLASGALAVRYELRDGSSARSPSLRLDLEERLGLRTFHSQLGQDKWILGVVYPGTSDGYFVDIGSWDAVKFSNSKALEEAGWQGVCADPFPRNWRDRTCQLFEEVVYGEAGQTVRFRRAGVLGGIEDHLGQENRRGAEVVEFTTTTLADMLARAGAPPFIHYLSIDTEGSEFEILRALPFDTYRIGAITVEHNHEEPKRTRIRELLEAHGYRRVREQLVEDWYLLEDLP